MHKTIGLRLAIVTILGAALMLTPAPAQARPSGVVISVTAASTTANRVVATYSLKGDAKITVVVQRVRGVAVVVKTFRAHTGTRSVSWSRNAAGAPMTPGRYVITMTAHRGSATASSSLGVDLE